MRKIMKRKQTIFILLIISLLLLTSCTHKKAEKLLLEYESKFNIEFPKEYDVLLYESISSIDSYSTYIVLKLNQEYELGYNDQFKTDYSKYNDFNVFNKIQLAKDLFKSHIKEKDEKYFPTSLTTFDWYAHEYTSVTGQYNVVRYVDLYVVYDQETNYLYLFYDQHQYPYNDQFGLS